MAYDFVLSIHCRAGFFMPECFQVEFMCECAFYGSLWFSSLCVCVDTHCFILCLSVPVDECLPVADYTWCKVYVQLNWWIKQGFIQCVCLARCE